MQPQGHRMESNQTAAAKITSLYRAHTLPGELPGHHEIVRCFNTKLALQN